MPSLDPIPKDKVVDSFSFLAKDGSLLFVKDRNITQISKTSWESAQMYKWDEKNPALISIGHDSNSSCYKIKKIKTGFGVYKYDHRFDETSAQSNAATKDIANYTLIETIKSKTAARNYLARLYQKADMWRDNLGRGAQFEDALGNRWKYVVHDSNFCKQFIRRGIEEESLVRITDENGVSNIQAVCDDLTKHFGSKLVEHIFKVPLQYFYSLINDYLFPAYVIHPVSKVHIVVKKDVNDKITIEDRYEVSRIAESTREQTFKHSSCAELVHIRELSFLNNIPQEITKEAYFNFFEAATKPIVLKALANKSLSSIAQYSFNEAKKYMREEYPKLKKEVQENKPSLYDYFILIFTWHRTERYKKYIEKSNLLKEWEEIKNNQCKKWEQKIQQKPFEFTQQGSYFATLNKIKDLTKDLSVGGCSKKYKKLGQTAEEEIKKFSKENLEEIQASLRKSFQAVFDPNASKQQDNLPRTESFEEKLETSTKYQIVSKAIETLSSSPQLTS